MKENIEKLKLKDNIGKLLLVAPSVMLVLLLVYTNYGFNSLKDTMYQFVSRTSEESIKNFSFEMDELAAVSKYMDEGALQAQKNQIMVYNKALGARHGVVTFLLDKEANIFHSNESNQSYLSGILKDQDNANLIKLIAATSSINKSGYLKLTRNGTDQFWYYQTLSGGVDEYRILMYTDKNKLMEELHTTKIIIPICIMGFILLVVTEASIWLRTKKSLEKKIK